MKAFAINRKDELPILQNSCELKVMQGWYAVSDAMEEFNKVNISVTTLAETQFSNIYCEAREICSSLGA